jgi:hypothetical protein
MQFVSPSVFTHLPRINIRNSSTDNTIYGAFMALPEEETSNTE